MEYILALAREPQNVCLGIILTGLLMLMGALFVLL
jgi:hypothetical protein